TEWHRVVEGPEASHSAAELTFGPVMERLITDAFDLDTGTSYDSSGTAPPNSPKEVAYKRWDWLVNSNGVEWMKDRGADLLAMSDGVIGHAAVFSLKEQQSETMTPRELESWLQNATIGILTPLSGQPYAF